MIKNYENDLNRWYHMCCLFDDANNVTISYLNGMEIQRSFLHLTRPIFGDNAFLGQGGWEYQSFSGEITQVWKDGYEVVFSIIISAGISISCGKRI